MGRIFPMGLAGVGLILACQVAGAADLSPVYKAPVAQPMAAQLFNGAFVGLNVGYGFGDWDSTTSFGRRSFDTTTSVDGVFGGAQAGYNWRLNQFVLGVEGDIQASGINGSFDVAPARGRGPHQTGELDLSWFSTIRGRAGVTYNNWLFYGTGGAAFGEVKYSSDGFSDSKVRAGYAVGAGIETAFAPNWTAKVEYLYVDLGDVDFDAGHRHFSPASKTFSTSTDEHMVRFGANYQFGR
jgi:outer membrane immunogenic protein